ncbi:hypothetical protein [Rickettsiella endosymbiont of Miltochrista miniata]|uniref:hypothetical protein n=1 Tax=Rickettsiella endosymbiont of Miltochrista miniata TaxID=3066239 RepID=UPI00313BF8AF
MPFPIEIQNALRVYDNNKGFWRRLRFFGRDQAAIRALRRLGDAEQLNFLKINQCFIENLPKVTQESYKVYQAVTYLNPAIAEVTNELYSVKLLKHINVDSLNHLDTHQFENLASIVKRLSNAQLLTQQNLASIALYYEAPEKLSIIASAVDKLTAADRLKQEDFSELSKLLKELYHNQLFTQENIDHLVDLYPNNIRILTHLVEKLHSSGLLTPNNFDNTLKHPNRVETIGIIANAVNMLEDKYCLNQINLDSIFEKPGAAVNIASILILLDQSELLTDDNRSKLLDSANQFLLESEAYVLVWRPLETYLPQLADVNERQSVFDHIIDLAQQENPAEKIETYLLELNPESNRPRKHRDLKFNTAPPANTRNNLNSLVSEDSHNQFVRQPTI